MPKKSSKASRLIDDLFKVLSTLEIKLTRLETVLKSGECSLMDGGK